MSKYWNVPEEASLRCSKKYLLCKISKNLQKNILGGVNFGSRVTVNLIAYYKIQ